MIWQDIMIFICMIFFGYALIPQIYHNYKHKRGSVTIQTSLITSVGMFILAVCFFTLQMYLTMAIEIVMAGLWLTLFIQKLKYGWQQSN